MGITQGTLVKRGKTWGWKYRVDGEVRWESLKVASKHDAELIRQQRMAEYHQDRSRFLREELNPTIADFEARYFEGWAADHKRASTIVTEKTFWKQLVDFRGAKRLGDITTRDIERFKVKLKTHGGALGRPLKLISINDALRHLRTIFNYAIKLGFFTGENPMNGVQFYRLPHSLPEFLSLEEVERLVEAAKIHSQAIHWVYLLALYAGMRKNEVVNARWKWFDFEGVDGPIIRIMRHDGFELKDHEERSLPMSSKIANALKPHRKDSGFLFESGVKSEGFWRYRYEPRRAFNAVREGAGVPKASFLLTRHTFASWHIMNGTEIALVSRWLGHSKIDITMKYYAGLKPYHAAIENF